MHQMQLNILNLECDLYTVSYMYDWPMVGFRNMVL